MTKTIEPKLRKIGEYLKLEKNSKFIIPEYQRPYSWPIERCDKLWQDIIEYSKDDNKENYFFGTVIINCKEDDNIYELIDGQQRTTTFLLLLKALLIKINDLLNNFNQNDKESSRLFNGLKAKRKKLLSIIYKAEDEEIFDIPDQKDIELYNNINLIENISINEDYKEELNKILKSATFDDAEAAVHHIKRKQKDNVYTNFFKNFKFFYNEKINSLDSTQVNSLTKTILENCEIIEIKNWKIEQAINMFNTLNSDGMPLTSADIISAKFFAASTNNKELYKETWRSFLDNVNTLESLKILDIDSILNQYMYLTRAKEKEFLSNSGAINVTVPGMRRYFTSENPKLIQNPIATCKDLLSLSKIWIYLSNSSIFNILLKFNENSKLFMGCFFNRYLTLENIDEINISEIESMSETMIKLFAILELVDTEYSSKKFKTFLFEESLKLVDSNIPISKIIEDFKKHINSTWTKEDIKQEILDYDKQALVYLNEYVFTKNKNLTFDLGDKYDIEHIMPGSGNNIQSIRKDAKINDDEEFKYFINKLGNKILLEQKINRSLGNQWFRTKILNDVESKQGYVNSKFAIAKSLVEHYKNNNKPYWTKEDINEKTEKAADRIVNFIFD